MSNLSTSWAFVLREPDNPEPVVVRVKVPTSLPQWVPLKSGVAAGERCYVSLQELVRQNGSKLFPGVAIEHATLFRVSRNADIAIEEDTDNSIKELVEEQLRQRRFQPVVRLEFGESPRPEIRDGLMDRFDLRDSDVYELPGPLDYTALFAIASLPIPELRDPPWSPLVPLALDDEADLFAVIRAGDLLVHHPYESFDATVERFIRDAADDPAVTTIKMTVYRLGDDTPFVRSLIKAAENAKQVACLVELKARFDEERNLHWASELQKAGDHVIYGVRGL
jgi:polyphosphate kinase